MPIQAVAVSKRQRAMTALIPVLIFGYMGVLFFSNSFTIYDTLLFGALAGFGFGAAFLPPEHARSSILCFIVLSVGFTAMGYAKGTYGGFLVTGLASLVFMMLFGLGVSNPFKQTFALVKRLTGRAAPRAETNQTETQLPHIVMQTGINFDSAHDARRMAVHLRNELEKDASHNIRETISTCTGQERAFWQTVLDAFEEQARPDKREEKPIS
ncbi:MAG: hypothetical protein AAF940_10680 [Pseudomonadota bacterium]